VGFYAKANVKSAVVQILISSQVHKSFTVKGFASAISIPQRIAFLKTILYLNQLNPKLVLKKGFVITIM
jgi:hypothetical protein